MIQFFSRKMILKTQTIKFNAQYMNELINSCISVRLRAVSDTSANGFTKRVALNMIKFLKKEYHIK